MSSDAQAAESYETPADAGEDAGGVVRLWLDAIHLAQRQEEHWRKKVDDAVDRYRDEKERKGRRFNILFANTQTLLPAIYNSAPQPDVRRRFSDADPVGKVAAQVLERALSYSLDTYDFDGTMRAAVFDMVLAGRGVVRVRYEPVVEGERITSQAVTCGHVYWRDVTLGPAREWPDMPWICFVHRLTREEMTAQFGDVGATVPLDVITDEKRAKDDPRDVPEVFKRGTVYEIWDKATREVLFIAPTHMAAPLKREPDPLGLRDFFPIPRPIYDVMDSGSMVPVVPFELYRDQSEELDRVTRRITSLIEVCKFRGLRASEIQEFKQLAEAGDGEFVPVENAMQFIGSTGGGGLERAMWTMPIETLVNVIAQLVQHREQIKGVIYEITGLSDILRGASQASETATAQQIKAQWGSLRIQDRQAEVRRFERDIVRIKAELIAEKFEPEMLAVMTGTNLPTAEQKMQAQMAAQMGVQDPAIMQALQTPSWDDVMGILRSDAMRTYRVDIETDVTIEADVMRQQQNAAQFVQGFGGFVQAMGPAVQAGMIPMDVAADLMTAFARAFKLGRQAEDALERLGQSAQNMPPPGQGNEAAQQAAQQAEQLRVQAQQAKAQAEMALTQAKTQGQMATLQARTQADMAKHQMQMESMMTEAQVAAAVPDVRSVL